MTSRRIVLTLESRATYGYSANVMQAMKAYRELIPLTVVTGTHLMSEFGNTVDLIRADGFPVSEEVAFSPDEKGKASWARALGTALSGYAEAFERLQPDIVLLSGDRAETLAFCVAAAYMGIPVAHIQAGDKSGHIDDAARYAIGKLAHIHFASCEDSANRLIRMGEQPNRVFNVGAPQLDDIVNSDFSANSIEFDGRKINLTEPYILLVQHPVMAEQDDTAAQMEAILSACLEGGQRVIWIYPNSDQGYRAILDVIADKSRDERVIALQNVDRDDYLKLLANAAVLVGNSSSGILEAPSFCVPVVNIGTRQRGRPQAANILNCSNERTDICRTIDQALNDGEFRQRCVTAVNPYGDGRSASRICEILRDIPLDRKLMDKESTY